MLTKIEAVHQDEGVMIYHGSGAHQGHLVLRVTEVAESTKVRDACIDPDSLGAALAAETGGMWIGAGELPEVRRDRHLLYAGGAVGMPDDVTPEFLEGRARGLLAMARRRRSELAQQEADAAAEQERNQARVEVVAEAIRAARFKHYGIDVPGPLRDTNQNQRDLAIAEARAAIAALDAAKGVEG